MTKKKKKKLPRTIKESKYQIGKTNLELDKKRVALKPGKRLSKEGNIYWENRKNRSDKDQRKKL